MFRKRHRHILKVLVCYILLPIQCLVVYLLIFRNNNDVLNISVNNIISLNEKIPVKFGEPQIMQSRINLLHTKAGSQSDKTILQGTGNNHDNRDVTVLQKPLVKSNTNSEIGLQHVQVDIKVIPFCNI